MNGWQTCRATGPVRLLVAMGLVVTLHAGCTEDGAERPAPAPTETGSASATTGEAESAGLTIVGTATAGNAVEVAGIGLRPGPLDLVQCRPSDGTVVPEVDCDTTLPGTTKVRVDADGRLETSVTLHSAIGIGQRSEIDCLSEGCTLAVTDGLHVLASTPITWAAGTEPSPPPVLRIVETRPSGVRLTAEVRGSGFPANAEIFPVQCPVADSAGPADVEADHCLYDAGVVARTGADGSVAFALTLARTLSSRAGKVDCATTPEACAIAEPWPDSPGARMSRTTLSAADVAGWPG